MTSTDIAAPIDADTANVILLATIAKSGTNYFRLFLTNYIYCLLEDIREPITWGRMHKEIFTNTYVAGQPLSKPGPSPIGLLGYRDFVYQHWATQLERFKGKIVFLYRNPFDVLISYYFYSHANRKTTPNKAGHIREIMDDRTEADAINYALMFEAAKRFPNSMLLAYEDMTRRPQEVFAGVLEWLSIPVQHEALDRAIEFSSIPTVRKEEDRDGPIHTARVGNFVGYFTRDGRVGQWKEYFSAEDIVRMTRILERHGLKLDDFILE